MRRCTLALLLSLASVGSAGAYTVFQDGMEGGPGGWTATGLWHWAGPDGCGEAHAGLGRWVYADPGTCTFDTGGINSGALTSPSISLPGGYAVAQLSFWDWYETESNGISWDRRYVQVSVEGGPFQTVAQQAGDVMGRWHQKIVDLRPFVGHNVQLRFLFDTVDAIANHFGGWRIDDVLVYTSLGYTATPEDYSWQDIAQPGNLIADWTGGWPWWSSVPLGFNFNYGGSVVNRVYFSPIGYEYLTDLWNNYPVEPFFEWLDFSTVGSKTYAATLGAPPNRRFVLQYENIGTAKLNYQMILSEADGKVTFQYKDMLSVDPAMGDGRNAEIGLGWPSSFYYSWYRPSVTDEMAVSFTGDADGDGLPDWWEVRYGTDPANPEAPVLTDDADDDDLNWLQEYQYGANPLDADTDGDGVPDGEEVAGGTNPALLTPYVLVTFAGPGSTFGTAYFQFNASGLPYEATGYRVFYGATSSPTVDGYDASFDLLGSSVRSGLIDQSWGLQGVPEVFFRVAAIRKVGGRTDVGVPSAELRTYFAGSEPNGSDGPAPDPSDGPDDETQDATDIADSNGSPSCFVQALGGSYGTSGGLAFGLLAAAGWLFRRKDP